MNKPSSGPGVSRTDRISEQGLERLRNHLESGTAISSVVLSQWIRRYGDAAREIIRQHGQYLDEFDLIE
jgi:hypothetical protein